MANKRENQVEPSAQTGGSGLGTLAAAFAAKGLAASPAQANPPEAAAETAGPPQAGAAAPQAGLRGKIVLRFQRKGRGGKAVTLIEKLELDGRGLEALSRELKKQLGCGVSVEGPLLVAQGDQRERLSALLTARGAKQIVLA